MGFSYKCRLFKKNRVKKKNKVFLWFFLSFFFGFGRGDTHKTRWNGVKKVNKDRTFEEKSKKKSPPFLFFLFFSFFSFFFFFFLFFESFLLPPFFSFFFFFFLFFSFFQILFVTTFFFFFLFFLSPLFI